MSNSIGVAFRVTSFGESHGRCVGVVVDGCPAGLPLNIDGVQAELDRRRPGQSSVTTSRGEEDRVEVLSGVYESHTTGAPIAMLVWNRDADSSRYLATRDTPRPGHADYAARLRYGGYADPRGGGRFSGRITAGSVMAGAVAKQLLATIGVEVHAYTSVVAGVEARQPTLEEAKTLKESNAVRCPDPEAAKKMIRAIEAAKADGDSVGGAVDCLAVNLLSGLGDPVYDTLEGDLAKALYAIPAVKAVEFGSGVRLAAMRGSEANDTISIESRRVTASGIHSGGIQGGISVGAPIRLRATFKPTPSIQKPQQTVNLRTLSEEKLTIEGRHDPCIVPRAVPVVEAVVATVLADHAIRASAIPRVMETRK